MDKKLTDFSLLISNNMEVENFNEGYFSLHSFLVDNGKKINSRNGEVVELLDFTTRIKNPVIRCVGGRNRNINIFFLLAEAMWIWTGRRDVKFLDIFNSRMKDYSDDGKNFNAPYGWRMRNFGIDSMITLEDSNKHVLFDSIDQIEKVLNMLHSDPETRRAVVQIWNAEFDLKDSKDIPCNDILMFKIRENKLNLTIMNRSNDLDWGLCTNVFQFSFVLEIMSRILGVEVGTQVHNSQSLHLYTSNPLTKNIETSIVNAYLYDDAVSPMMDFDFDGCQTIDEKLNKVDFWLKSLISKLLFVSENNTPADDEFGNNLFTFSEFFYMVYKLLEVYVLYKNKTYSRFDALTKLRDISLMNIAYKSDYLLLAMNFFVVRIQNDTKHTKEEMELVYKIQEKISENVGRY